MPDGPLGRGSGSKQTKRTLQVGDALQEDERQVEEHVVRDHEVLRYLPHIPNVRDDAQAALLRQQRHSQALGRPAETRRVGLADLHTAGGDKVFKDHFVGDAFAHCNRDGVDRLCQRRMGVDVCSMRGLLDPIRLQRCKLVANFNGLRQGPLLVGVECNLKVVAYDPSDHRHPSQIALHILRSKTADF